MSYNFTLFRSIGKTTGRNKFNMLYSKVPEFQPLSARVRAGPRPALGETPMKRHLASPPTTATPVTLKNVLERLAADDSLSDTRRRDLRSAITRFAKLRGETPAAIPLDLAEIAPHPR